MNKLNFTKAKNCSIFNRCIMQFLIGELIMAEKDKYSRGLKSRHVQLIALGGTIGTGLFLGSGKSIHSAGPSIVLAYLITGVICFLLMRAMGELLL